MAEEPESRKPEPFPPAVEPDEQEQDEEVRTDLSEQEVEEEADEAIHEIEEDADERQLPKAKAPPPPGPEGPGLIDRAWEAQYRLEARFKKVGRGRYSRVLKMARKPEPEEFRRASQITAIGIGVIGLIGFLILLFMGWLMDLLGVQ
jgi:protein transport protein SEC61 subunit gamma-like protein